MQLAKSMMLKSLYPRSIKFLPALLAISVTTSALAQDNSPYSRYGLGDVSSPTNITSRGMGGISAGYNDVISVNFTNPASYSQFQTYLEQRSKRLSAGRIILDVGMNFDNRTLVKPNTPERFTSADAFFSYLQVGLPLRKNWGLSFGIRPVSRVSYLINRDEYLMGTNPNDTIERAITQFRGSGGSYLPTIGTGFAIGKLSAGFNVGYLLATGKALPSATWSTTAFFIIPQIIQPGPFLAMSSSMPVFSSPIPWSMHPIKKQFCAWAFPGTGNKS